MTLPAQWEHALNAFLLKVYDPGIGAGRLIAARDQRRKREIVHDFLCFLVKQCPSEQPLDAALVEQELPAYLEHEHRKGGHELLTEFAEFVKSYQAVELSSLLPRLSRAIPPQPEERQRVHRSGRPPKNAPIAPGVLPADWEHTLNTFFVKAYDPTIAVGELRGRRKMLTDFLLFLVKRWGNYEEPLTGHMIKRGLSAYLDTLEVDDLLERPDIASTNRLLNLALLNEFYQFVSPPPVKGRSAVKPPSQPRREKGQGPRPIAPQLLPTDEWAKMIPRFLADRCTSAKSRRTYSDALRLFFATCNKHPADVRRSDVAEFLAFPIQRGTQPAAYTYNSRLTVIRSFYKYASTCAVGETEEPLYRKLSPAFGLKYRKAISKPKGLSKEEIARFFAAIDLGTGRQPNIWGWRDRAIFMTALYTASRREALCGLKFGDIEPATFGTGARRRQGYRYRSIRKGSQGNYIYAELPEPARVAIWEYLEISGRLASIEPEDPLFVAHVRWAHPCEPKRPISSATVNARMKTYLRKAQISMTHSMHSWRHASAQLRYRSGQDLLSISKTLGHASIQTTQIYLMALCDEQDDGAAALARELGEL